MSARPYDAARSSPFYQPEHEASAELRRFVEIEPYGCPIPC
jgi:hypothetical protein